MAGPRHRLLGVVVAGCIVQVTACGSGHRRSPPPTTTTTSTTVVATTTTVPAVTYRVKRGDTLGGIAHKFHVSVGAIAAANNIANPDKIREGDLLVIPPVSAVVTTTTAP